MIPFELDIKDHQENSIAWNSAHLSAGWVQERSFRVESNKNFKN